MMSSNVARPTQRAPDAGILNLMLRRTGAIIGFAQDVVEAHYARLAAVRTREEAGKLQHGNRRAQGQSQRQQMARYPPPDARGGPPIAVMPQQGGMMMPGDAPMPANGMAAQEMQQQAQQAQQAQQQPQSGAAQLASQLANASPDEQRMLLGETLYPMIESMEPSNAAKITGMLLEMDQSEVLHLIESPESLQAKVAEAISVLKAAAAPPSDLSGMSISSE